MHPPASAVNPNVDIKEVPARTLVALSWNGNSPREAEVERRTAQLRQLMEQAGLKPKQGGKTHVWQYGERCLGRGAELCGCSAVQCAALVGPIGCTARGDAANASGPCREPAPDDVTPCLPSLTADPPFQWGILRTNEVLIEVDGDAAQS